MRIKLSLAQILSLLPQSSFLQIFLQTTHFLKTHWVILVLSMYMWVQGYELKHGWPVGSCTREGYSLCSSASALLHACLEFLNNAVRNKCRAPFPLLSCKNIYYLTNIYWLLIMSQDLKLNFDLHRAQMHYQISILLHDKDSYYDWYFHLNYCIAKPNLRENFLKCFSLFRMQNELHVWPRFCLQEPYL